MLNKRLLAWLLVFVFIGGAILASALVFRVQDVRVHFAHTQTVFVDKDEATDSFERIVTNVAGGRNIIIGLNRNRIIRAVEEADPRIRVRQIEARFPNRLNVRVQERFPMYFIQYGGLTAILDYQLQIVSNERRFVDGGIDIGEGWRLIDISEQFTLNKYFMTFEIGDNLSQFAPYDVGRMETLILMSRLFFGQKIMEEEICHLVEKIDFNASDAPPNTMVMVLRDPLRWTTSIRIEIRDFGYNFNDKLARAWWVLQHETDYRQGILIVYPDLQVSWELTT